MFNFSVIKNTHIDPLSTSYVGEIFSDTYYWVLTFCVLIGIKLLNIFNVHSCIGQNKNLAATRNFYSAFCVM
jgi:hypothetical protein